MHEVTARAQIEKANVTASAQSDKANVTERVQSEKDNGNTRAQSEKDIVTVRAQSEKANGNARAQSEKDNFSCLLTFTSCDTVSIGVSDKNSVTAPALCTDINKEIGSTGSVKFSIV